MGQQTGFHLLSRFFIIILVLLAFISFTAAQDVTPEITDIQAGDSSESIDESAEPSPDTPSPIETPVPATDVPTVEPPTVEPITPELTAAPTDEVTPEVIETLQEPVEAIPNAEPLVFAEAVSLLVVTNTNDSGDNSLRGAINFANSNPGVDTITFDIPGDGPHVIDQQSFLPDLTDGVTIDGLSQPGATCDVWPPTLKIELQGGLNLYGANYSIRGLALSYFNVDAGNTTIQCNFIGTDITGTVSKGSYNGIYIRAMAGVIGGVGPGTRNLISGNVNGIYALETPLYPLAIQGNYIGTDVNGEAGLGNDTGIELDTVSGITIGGTIPGAGNLISGNGMGISISFDSDFTITGPLGSIEGNLIGTNPSGTAAVPNRVGISATAPILIGGSEPGARNLISGNSDCGVSIHTIEDSAGSVVQGNIIGMDITGTIPLGNGCGVNSVDGSTIMDNVISGNNGPGAVLIAALQGGNVLENNIIGMDVSGTQPLGNQAEGVRIEILSNVGQNYVTNNRIAYNNGAGVSVVDPFSGNPSLINSYQIVANRIFANGGLGIDLMNNGVTPNDPADLLGLQNYPVLDVPVIGATAITGALDTMWDETFTIAIYANTVCDPSGFGEGEMPLAEGQVLTDEFGQAVFSIPVSGLTTGQYITATATSYRATSEFSRCVRVGGEVVSQPLVVTNTNNSGAGSLRAAIEYANSNPGTDTITFNIPGNGPYVIQPQSPLPEISDSLTIDGTSQPGASCDVWPPTLKIELRTKLFVEADDTQIRGLVFNRSGGIETIAAYTDITCNFIGTDVTGTVATNDQWAGIIVADAFIKIGGTSPTERNLISGNLYGIFAVENGAKDVIIQGNYIGTDVTGQFPLGNDTGIYMDTVERITIGGTIPGMGNLISGNQTGIFITYDTDFSVIEPLGSIQGNIIGANASGTMAVPNDRGIGMSRPMLIGGDEPGARNLISGNLNCGVEAGMYQDRGSNGTLIKGNYIGTDITGTQALGNGCGVRASGDVTIVDNLISGNNGTGVILGVAIEDWSRLENNIIGADVTGTKPLGNQSDGVNIVIPASQPNLNSVEVSHNLIAYNAGAGVGVTNQSAGFPDDIGAYSIRANRIFANGGLGIDLKNDGVTPNDPGDADGSLLGLLNFPELNKPSIGATAVSGTLNSLPDAQVIIQVYANATCDPSGYGEGEIFIGQGQVTTDASGNAVFNVTVTAIQAGQHITATASFYSTSEFSRCVQVMAGPPPPVLRYPTNNSTVSTSRPAFNWFPVPNARRYRIQLSADPNFATLIADQLEDSTVEAPATLLPGGYYWRVQTRSISGVWGAFSEVRYFEYVIMQSPVYDAHSFGAFPIFTWNAYPKARRYQVEIDNNADFSSPESVCTYTYRVLTTRPCGLANGLPYGDYYWRVNIDLGNGFIVSPIAWRFSYVIRYVATPRPLSPIGVISGGSNIPVTWSAVSGAEYYQVEMSRDATFRNVTGDYSNTTVQGTESDFRSLSPGQYYWRVRAWMPNGAPTLWSTTASFEVR